MMGFSDLDTRVVRKGRYKLLAPLKYRGPRGKFAVQAGFITDFASIPRGFRWLVTGHDETRKPAVIHDYLYRNRVGTRRFADLVFKDGLEEERAPRWKIWLCYSAVRVGGWATWKK